MRLISQRIITFSPKSEKNTTNDGERMYGGTAIRRNLEAMQRLLLEHTLRSYHDHLPKQMSHAQFFDFLDHHFTIVRGSELTTSGDRGNYDARLVSDTVYLLRDAFRDQLAGNGQNEIYVYGSFVNGKANLATSDLDILMNEPMLNAHYLPYFNERTLSTEDYRHWEAPIRSDHTGDARGTHENQERWRRAERAIAHRWTGHDVEPGHLLKIFPRKRSETKFVDFSIFASYNPLVIKINRDGIHLIIYNAFEPGLSHDVFISN